MESNAIILSDDTLKEIFTYSYLYDKAIIGKFRSVCKNWHDIFNPITIHQIVPFNPYTVLIKVAAHSEAKNNDNISHCIQFITAMLKNQPDVYTTIIYNLIQKNNHDNLQAFLENGAHPAIFTVFFKDPPIVMTAHNLKVFKLLLEHGGNTLCQKSESYQKIMNAALTNAKHGDYKMLKSILRGTGHSHPHYQKDIDAFLTQEKQKSIDFLLFLTGVGILLVTEYITC